MKQNFIITGTDTDVGKTLCSAQYLLQTGGTYWKPIQAGRPRDREKVQQQTGLDDSHFLPEIYDLTQPLSPHQAAAYDGVLISLDRINPPKTVLHPPLIIEGAGGVFVPLNDTQLMIDLFCHLDFPLLIVARSTLGTINHTLLTVECVRKRGLQILGVVVVGPYNQENEKALSRYGDVEILGRISIPQ